MNQTNAPKKSNAFLEEGNGVAIALLGDALLRTSI